HGCNSMLATKLGLKLAEYTVTEAGFGADLGAEKFFDIKARFGNLKPDAAVIVATVRALKHHGGVKKEDWGKENFELLAKGFENLEKHIENVNRFGVPAIVAFNKFPTDTQAELDFVVEKCEALGATAVISEVWNKGGEGGEDLARKVVEVVEKGTANFKPLYDVEETIKAKIEKIAKEIYGADGVDFTSSCLKTIANIEKMGFDKMPICMAKTQYSMTDDPTIAGRPRNFRITVRDIKVSRGAGFLVALTGEIMTMPGLPKVPAAESIDILPSGEIVGLF
ncbi:MAG TPA: formate--tetrahydrofolate ligase, partial [Tissierellales bacterium]|nr:formate--tetrahydrofolate ligase [Tissierellales bacterium]